MLALTLANAAQADPPFCMPSFAAVADEDAEPLIRDTYRVLFHQLGSDLSPDVLETVSIAPDPFALPPEIAEQKESLAKRLRELKEMVESKHWNSPRLRRRLSEALWEQATERRGLVRQQKLSEELNGAPHLVHPLHGFTLLSPDGRYVIQQTSAMRAGNTQDFAVYDTETRKRTEIKVPQGDYGEGVFIEGGKAILLPTATGQMTEVPFREGLLHFNEARIIPSKPLIPFGRHASVRPLPDGKRVLLTLLENDPSVVLYDHTRGAWTPLRIKPRKNFAPANLSWGVRENDGLVYVQRNAGFFERDGHVHLYKISDDGLLIPQPGLRTPVNTTGTIWLNDGTLATRRKRSMLYQPKPGGAWQESPLPEVTGGTTDISIALREPAGDRIGLVLGSGHFFWFEPKTGKYSAVELPGHELVSLFSFSPDGRRVLYQNRTDSSRRFLRPIEYFNPVP